MSHPLFVAHVKMMKKLHAEETLTAADVALAQFHKQSWWDTLISAARGVAAQATESARALFSWNGAPVHTSQGLRQKFAESVSTRVES